MRKYLIVTAILAMTLLSFTPAEAARRTRAVRSPGYGTSRPGVFQALMEFERRKNELIFGRR
jgi:hypothetical protein